MDKNLKIPQATQTEHKASKTKIHLFRQCTWNNLWDKAWIKI